MAKDLENGDPSRVGRPTPASGGEGEESPESARSTSGRLRHKDRSVSRWDYQRMVLAAFPKIGRVVAACAGLAAIVLSAWMLTQIRGPRDPSGWRLPGLDKGDLAKPSDESSATPTSTPTTVPSPTPPPPEISINFNADRYTIEQGECTTLRWAVTGADRIDLLDQEREATEAQRVCPDQTTGYTLLAENDSEQDSAFLQIEVAKPQDNGPKQGCLVYDAQTQQDVCQVPCQQPNPEQYPVCHQ